MLGMKTIAVVGLSDKPERPSFAVAAYLLGKGYDIAPVNPLLSEWKGRKCYPDLLSIPFPVDVVDVFRKSEAAPEIARQAVAIKAKGLWLQEGVVSIEAERMAKDARLLFVMDRCLKKEREKKASLEQ